MSVWQVSIKYILDVILRRSISGNFRTYLCFSNVNVRKDVLQSNYSELSGQQI